MRKSTSAAQMHHHGHRSAGRYQRRPVIVVITATAPSAAKVDASAEPSAPQPRSTTQTTPSARTSAEGDRGSQRFGYAPGSCTNLPLVPLAPERGSCPCVDSARGCPPLSAPRVVCLYMTSPTLVTPATANFRL